MRGNVKVAKSEGSESRVCTIGNRQGIWPNSTRFKASGLLRERLDKVDQWGPTVGSNHAMTKACQEKFVQNILQ